MGRKGVGHLVMQTMFESGATVVWAGREVKRRQPGLTRAPTAMLLPAMTQSPDFSDDIPILHALGMANAPLIGYGGEARVYAPDARRVLRLLHPGATLPDAKERAGLLIEIARGANHLPFATPEIDEVREVGTRIAIFERRLPGIPLSALFARCSGQERRASLAAYFDVAGRLREIDLRRDFFGDLIAQPPVRTASHRAYLRARIAQTRQNAGPLAHRLSDDIANGMPDCPESGFVHFDLFPGNVLMENGRVTAVIDFGATAMIADPRLEVWSAAAYLDPEISPDATAADRAFASDWLAERGLDADYPAARRWIAAYWCFAQDDPKVMAWCRSVLA